MSTSIRVAETSLFFIPVRTRVPLKFGAEVLDSVTVARVAVTLESDDGGRAVGWGETPLSAQWAWPGEIKLSERVDAMRRMCRALAAKLPLLPANRHPVFLGQSIVHKLLPAVIRAEDAPYLAGLVCAASFDIAVHDAFGVLLECDVYDTYGPAQLTEDLSSFLTPEPASRHEYDFRGHFLSEWLQKPVTKLTAWHLVGGKDPVGPEDLTGGEPDDGYPVTLPEWIEADSLRCLKIKLRGTDQVWDFDRMVRVGELGAAMGVQWLSADFNCTVTDPVYVNEILDRLRDEHPRVFGSLLYVEQPFAYDLESHQIDVHSVSARKPLFMDESAHDWRVIRLGRELGWTGVALKTCKTQTGALLSMCWAKANGMQIMVQDLTNPMLAQIPHVRLASRAGTIMGVETNSMQFYPEVSTPEAGVHPGIYRRRDGTVDLSTLGETGFGYRINEIDRDLPDPEIVSPEASQPDETAP